MQEVGITTTVGSAAGVEDRKDLEEPVAYFRQGDGSAYLRATLKVMRSVKIAGELRDLQAYGHRNWPRPPHTLDEVPDLVRQSRRSPPRR